MQKQINHVAIIMDGNGRWAKKRFLPRSAGHVAGVKATKRAIVFAAQNNIRSLTVYAFSNENWNRPKDETDHLMNLFIKSLKKEIDEMHQNDICISFIGDRCSLSEKLIKSIEQSENLTRNNKGLKLNIALNYGGQQEILQAVKNIASQNIDAESLTVEGLSKYMYLNNQKNVDLLIRTGGEQRISNFLLWHLAYAELFFTDTLWPDFTTESFKDALQFFNTSERRFGKTSEQIKTC